MLDNRRQLLRSIVSFATLFPFASRLFAQSRPQPQPIPSPNAPNPSYPQGLDGPGPTPRDQKTLDRQVQQEIRSDVDKMYAIVSDLKQELGVTNSNLVLNVAFVKQTHELEKLAKHVKDLARG